MKLDYTALRDLIAKHESESSAANQGVPDGYDVCSWYIPREEWPQNNYGTHLTEMSVSDVSAWQNAIVKRVPSLASTAAGRYQIIRKTLESLDWPHKFDRASQDALCDQLLDRRGATKWENGETSDAEFGQNLAMEWAALPIFFPANGNQPGEGYYDGDGKNMAGVSCQEVLDALAKVRATGSAPVAPEPPLDENDKQQLAKMRAILLDQQERIETLERIMKGQAYQISQEYGE